jgi:hypothetical protein
MTKLLQQGDCPYLQRCVFNFSKYLWCHKKVLPFLFLFFSLNELVPTLLLYQELDLSGLGVTSDVVKLDLSKNSIEDLPNELSLCSSLQVSFLEWKYRHIFYYYQAQHEYLAFALFFSVLSFV